MDMDTHGVLFLVVVVGHHADIGFWIVSVLIGYGGDDDGLWRGWMWVWVVGQGGCLG